MEFFSKETARWFSESFGKATEVQKETWKTVSAGRNVLSIAPTGSGKTLAAFLYAIDSLFSGRMETGACRVLYVSPLRALGNDIRRNLDRPIREIGEYYKNSNIEPPSVRTGLRTSDTSESERRSHFRHPPEILITTPESLHILLASDSGRTLLSGVRTVILDEIHAVAGTKRGTHLMAGVETLTLVAGEFQRIALSATVADPALTAAFAGGFFSPPGNPDLFLPRDVDIVRPAANKVYQCVSRILLEDKPDDEDENRFWARASDRLLPHLDSNRTTLFFVNNRKLAEQLSRHMQDANRSVYPHHGSLSREVRAVVEERLKTGKLSGIVATSSLELGIDIGDLDEVVMVGVPSSVASALQRMGRSGHGVGEISRASLYARDERELLIAAALLPLALRGELEEVRPVENPLDVLAQILLALLLWQKWDTEELYRHVRRIYNYQNLPREWFYGVMRMLSGKYESTRIFELQKRISYDEELHEARAFPAVRQLIYLSGGTIPDRGYFTMRDSASGAPIGELDEEFVWERRMGEIFSLGGRTWKILEITHSEMRVRAEKSDGVMAPFWRADENDRGAFLSDHIIEFLDQASVHLKDRDFADSIARERFMEPASAGILIEYLKEAREALGQLPGKNRFTLEICPDRLGLRRFLLYNFLGGKRNRPLFYLFSRACEELCGYLPEGASGDDGIMLLLPDEVDIDALIERALSLPLEGTLRRCLEGSGFFGSRFRESAGRSLLLPRANFKGRVPLWLTRLRAKKIMEALPSDSDFPVLLETWRTVLHDEFELPGVLNVLERLRSGEITIHVASTSRPSVFSSNLLWKSTNRLMYDDDARSRPAEGLLSGNFVRTLLSASDLRIKISDGTISDFLDRRQRRLYPLRGLELAEHIKDRLFMAPDEVRAAADADEELRGRLRRVQIGDSFEAVFHADNLSFISSVPDFHKARFTDYAGGSVSLPSAPEEEDSSSLRAFLTQFLLFFGPLSESEIERGTGLGEESLRDALEDLTESGQVAAGSFLEKSEENVFCHSGNFEILLRMQKKSRRQIRSLSGLEFQAFLAFRQGIAGEGNLPLRLEELSGCPLPAKLLETMILPSRLASYRKSELDEFVRSHDLRFFGSPGQKIVFCMPEEIDLFHFEDAQAPEYFPTSGRFSLSELVDRTRRSTGELTSELWKAFFEASISCDSYEIVRKGLERKFKASEETDLKSRRGGLRRWASSRPLNGLWYALLPSPPADPLEEEERDRERARRLLLRYGVVFRELVERELFAWKKIYRALTMLELAGEAVAGRFVETGEGIQFVDPSLLEQEFPSASGYWWISAADPASLCGVLSELPARRPTTSIVFNGNRVAMTAARKGRDVQLMEENPSVSLLDLFVSAVSRQFSPEKSVIIETINSVRASESEYATFFLENGFVRDYKNLVLWKKSV